MKKGCFISTVFTGTIIIGILFYIGDKYGDNIIEYFKGRAVEITANSADEYIDKLVQTDYQDSLKVIWKDVVESAQNMDFEDGINYVSIILLKVESITQDSLISKIEFSSFKEMIKNEAN